MEMEKFLLENLTFLIIKTSKILSQIIHGIITRKNTRKYFQ